MAARVSLDTIPQAGRPAAVERALSEATDLRDRLRAAQEERAAAAAELERLEQEDVQAAADKIRSGAAPGSPPATLAKNREKVELLTRNARALDVASTAAQADLVELMRSGSQEWLGKLDAEARRARDRAEKALGLLEKALAEIGAAAAAGFWLQAAAEDGRFDRAVSPVTTGSIAPSSASRTMNSEPLNRGELLDYCRELIDPPARARRPTLETAVPPA